MTGDDTSRDRIEVCPAAELPPGSRTIVEVSDQEVGIFNVDGELYAIANACPHQLAPLCEGRLTGEMTAPAVGEYELSRQGMVLRCPWHGWKFDIETGESVFNPHLRTRTYDVTIETLEEGDCSKDCTYGADLAGDEPPVDTYDVAVERSTVVLYV
ncbi:Ferredoxin subunit of nitrite reductase or a ring-hydroxylating dioxygenase [Natronorubrum sediminis]|uniref:Ferredoxin subunit of nitrite reductase or a ring-hydroxylating dioxygenase n=1 Tax=Natronorubrum sediminis TaxID=640943 RepID=A0A1H6G8J6_9EURY|nr:Rieske (2Fe-2S) protein [Natronorubrum sediminis]SEH18175.1 Ferredoxin subunit of nitrite reductase or a ring-hydroxylating dioxygenase [Natronorubrum sediminis]